MSASSACAESGRFLCLRDASTGDQFRKPLEPLLGNGFRNTLEQEVHYDALSNFPGSPVDLRFFFELEGDKIASLEIKPWVLPVAQRRTHMFAVYATHADPDNPLAALKIGDRPEPSVPEGWTRVKISQASLNRHDLFTLRGITRIQRESPIR